LAVDRLNHCEHIVELAKELGISRRLLYGWREKLEALDCSGAPPANAREATFRKEVSRSSGCWPRRSWRWIFSRGPCAMSRRDASGAARLARGHLRPDPSRDVEARRVADRADVSVSPG